MLASGPSKEDEMRFGETVFVDVKPSDPVGDAARISALICEGRLRDWLHPSSSPVVGENDWKSKIMQVLKEARSRREPRSSGLMFPRSPVFPLSHHLLLALLVQRF